MTQLTPDRIVTAPGVYVIGRQIVNDHELSRFLRDTGFGEWSSEAPAAGQLLVETGARLCYRSFNKGRPHDAHILNLLESGHGSCLEHCVFTVIITGVSRTLTHELVRHRVGLSPSQESQRYVNAADARFVPPPIMANNIIDYLIRRQADVAMGDELADARDWVDSIETALAAYENILTRGPFLFKTHKKAATEKARSVLPNAVETRIQLTGNARAWRHFLHLRGSVQAEPEIRRLAFSLWTRLHLEAPTIFGDYETKEDGNGTLYLGSQYGSI